MSRVSLLKADNVKARARAQVESVARGYWRIRKLTLASFVWGSSSVLGIPRSYDAAACVSRRVSRLQTIKYLCGSLSPALSRGTIYVKRSKLTLTDT